MPNIQVQRTQLAGENAGEEKNYTRDEPSVWCLVHPVTGAFVWKGSADNPSGMELVTGTTQEDMETYIRRNLSYLVERGETLPVPAVIGGVEIYAVRKKG